MTKSNLEMHRLTNNTMGGEKEHRQKNELTLRDRWKITPKKCGGEFGEETGCDAKGG